MIISSRLATPYNTRVSHPNLRKKISRGGEVKELEGGWRLSLPPGEAGSYRLAQLDDYGPLSRAEFPYRQPFHIRLSARASQAALPGTWGFGLWNDPFGLSLGFGGATGRLPALPNAAWFFFASPDNHLALNETAPGNGPMAAVYDSPRIPSLLLAPVLLLFPLLAWPPASRALRGAASKVIHQSGSALKLDPREWHQYSLNWQSTEVEFQVDGKTIYSSSLSPRGPLGLVLWLDNQYAAWRPNGSLGYGTLATPPDCWVEIKDLQLN